MYIGNDRGFRVSFVKLSSSFLLAFWLFCGPARAEFNDGNLYYQKCINDASSWCIGYAVGLYDAIILYQNYMDLNELKPFCAPRGLSAMQVHDIFMKYLRDHPDKRTLSASLIAAKSLHEAFPCR